jgi:hypothetical protein
MNAMLTKYLKDFSVPETAVPVENDVLAGFGGGAFSDLDFQPDPIPAIDLDAVREEAHAAGAEEARQVCEASHADEIEALQAAHADEMSEMMRRHEVEEIELIHARFQDMTLAISQAVAEQTLQVLVPIFDSEVARRAVEALSAAVITAMKEEKCLVAEVRGPEALYAALKPMLDADGVESRLVISDTLDLAVEVNQTVLVSRLSAWASALSGIVA